MKPDAGGAGDPAASKAKVALIQCPEYNDELVLRALRRGVDLLGGMALFSRPGEKILLKPNMLHGALPEKCVTTHPSVLRAMGILCQENGSRVSFGDSPGFGSARAAAEKTGLAAAADAIGMEQADFITPVQVSFHEALIAKQLILAKGAVETDGIISLAKMKTHGFMRITGAVKNQFGCVPGIRKGEFHVKMPQVRHFASMLVDINRLLKPRLYVLDGIMAMEGNGPGSGSPRSMKVLLLSSDPAALDAVFCKLISLPVQFVPTIHAAALGQLGKSADEEIDLCGDDLSPLVAPDFNVVRRPAVPFDRSFPYFLKKWITPRPYIDPSLCIHCGTCTEVCPLEPKAVQSMAGKKAFPPAFDYKRCIRCYCCQEMCPYAAIAIKRPLLSRIIHG